MDTKLILTELDYLKKKHQAQTGGSSQYPLTDTDHDVFGVGNNAGVAWQKPTTSTEKTAGMMKRLIC